jgi:DNA-binding transcriptional regulator LsrR (DeoR family)
MDTFETWLKRQKGENGLTQEQCAKAIGISRTHLCRILASGRASDKLKIKIQDYSKGEVPVQSWYANLTAAE